MAMPFRRISKTRKRKRRTHQKMTKPTTNICNNCGASVKSHYVCKECGYYKGKQVVNVETK